MGLVTMDLLNRLWKNGFMPKVTKLGTDLENEVRKLQTTLAAKFDASKIANNLLTTAAGYALDARQGKVLQDQVSSLDTGLKNIPTYYIACDELQTGNVMRKYVSLRDSRGNSAGQVEIPYNTWRGIQDNLTSTSTTQSLSAYQGKRLYDNRVVVTEEEFTTDENGNFMIWSSHLISAWLYPYDTYWSNYFLWRAGDHYFHLADSHTLEKVPNKKIKIRYAVVYNGWSGLQG